MDNKFNKFRKAYLNIINENFGDDNYEDSEYEDDQETQYAILDIETMEIEEFGDDPVELMEIISTNEEEGEWEENKYGVFEREGEDGEWEISEVVGAPGGGWR